MEPCKMVAEIGCLHLGDMDRARHLIKLAAFAGADYVKFQKRNPIESTPKKIQDKPHPNEKFAHGKTYLEHRINLEFSIEQHEELKKWCKFNSIGYSTSVWDTTSAREVVEKLNPDFIKIPSACNHNKEILNYLVEEYQGGIHISTGMSTGKELDDLFLSIMPHNKHRVAIYHCTSEYPCPFEHLYLREISRLNMVLRVLGDPTIDPVIGFSNHGYGIAADIAAYILGAQWIERHFVDDRTLRHTDASVSLEPDGLRKICRDLKAVNSALQFKEGITQEEEIQRNKLRSTCVN